MVCCHKYYLRILKDELRKIHSSNTDKNIKVFTTSVQ